MRTKAFLALCLFMGIGFTQISAQNGKNGNGAVSYEITWDGYYVDVPVYCGTVVVDRLRGTADIHIVEHYKGGVFMGQNVTYRAEVVGLLTDEVFEVKDSFKYIADENIGIGHCNLKGDKGTHYVLSYIWDGTTDTFKFLKAVCP